MLQTAAIFAALWAAVIPGQTQTLKVGDPAPPLKIKSWVKGEPVKIKGTKEKNGDKVYLVEFWATWCPPCVQSIPHLTKLQSKYGDKLVVVGVTDEAKATVSRFLKKQGKKMAYTVACDDSMKTSMSYMMASGQQGIPTAFIVDRAGRIAWIGSPIPGLGLDEVLDQVVAGTYDVERAAAEAAADDRFFREEHLTLFNAVQNGDWDKSVKIARNVADPSNQMSQTLRKELLDQVTWVILTDDRSDRKYYKDALSLIRAAVELTEARDASVMDTYALALFENGEIAEAVDASRAALDLAYEPIQKAEYAKRLASYRDKLRETQQP